MSKIKDDGYGFEVGFAWAMAKLGEIVGGLFLIIGIGGTAIMYFFSGYSLDYVTKGNFPLCFISFILFYFGFTMNQHLKRTYGELK